MMFYVEERDGNCHKMSQLVVVVSQTGANCRDLFFCCRPLPAVPFWLSQHDTCSHADFAPSKGTQLHQIPCNWSTLSQIYWSVFAPTFPQKLVMQNGGFDIYKFSVPKSRSLKNCRLQCFQIAKCKSQNCCRFHRKIVGNRE